jgi:hypothetical protein
VVKGEKKNKREEKTMEERIGDGKARKRSPTLVWKSKAD